MPPSINVALVHYRKHLTASILKVLTTLPSTTERRLYWNIIINVIWSQSSEVHIIIIHILNVGRY